ncbi:DNA methyltransferase [Pseudomonadota bacterium]
MQNLMEELKSVLAGDERLVIDGNLAKNKIVELALSLDKSLLELLLTNDSITRHFFTKVSDVLVFDKIKFQQFVSNKQFLPDSYTAFKNKIGLTANNEYLTESREVVLAWPYKDCVLEGGQTKEDQKRKEIFWNETLAPDEVDRLLSPKVLTNFKKYDKDGEHDVKNISLDDNLIVKGNNLLALHSLKKKYAGKVKLIYIDPPYNTGSDSFGYNDSFNHSSWLTFMRNRLEVAKTLLKEDGVIFVQCDDNEQAYAKVLLDNIFGIINHEVTLYVQVRFGQKTLNEDNDYQKLIEHIHGYRKSQFKPNKDIVPYSLDKFCWKIVEKTEGEVVTLGEKKVILFKNGEYEIRKTKSSHDALKETWATGSLANQGGSAAEFFKLYLEERKAIDGVGVLYKVLDMGTKGDGLGYRYITGPKKESSTKGKFYSGVPLRNIEDVKSGKLEKTKPIINLLLEGELYKDNFLDMKEDFGNCRLQGGVTFNSGKKPEQLLKRLIEISTNQGDIVLDYHLGSGTTCAVAHKMKRRYIGIEQMDYIESLSVPRLKNVINCDDTGISKEINWNGGGSFIYCELAQHNASVIDKIEQASSAVALIAIWQDIEKNDFISYKIRPETINENIHEFKTLSIEEQKQFLVAVLDKNQLYVNYSEIEDEDFQISDDDKTLNKQFYGAA